MVNKKLEQFKKSMKENLQPVKKVSKRLEKVTKSFTKNSKSKKSKAIGYKPKLSQTLLGFANANNMPQQSAGRPPKIFKHTSPLSGKPVPAEVYYAHMREFKRLQARRVEDAKEQQIREYAKRGIPPQQIAQIQERIRQQKLLEQVQKAQQPQPQPQNIQQNQVSNEQIQQLPQGTIVPQGNKIWKYRRGEVDTDWTAFGRRQVLRGSPGSMWN